MRLQKPPKQWILVLLLTLSVATALLGDRVAGRLRQTVQWAIAPLGDGGMYLTTAFKTRFGSRNDPTSDEAWGWYQRAQEQTLRANALEAQLRAERDRRMIRQLYGPSDDFPWQLIPGRVIGADPLGYGQTRVVNFSSTQGAESGQQVLTVLTKQSESLPKKLAVVTASALVGRVIETGPFTARVQLVTDRGFRTRGRIWRNPDVERMITVTEGEAATVPLTRANNRPIDVVAAGDGRGGMIVDDVKAYHNVKPGDWLVTWRDNAMLPVEIGIGRVVEVAEQPNHPAFVSLRIKPYITPATLRQVYLVVPDGLAVGKERND